MKKTISTLAFLLAALFVFSAFQNEPEQSESDKRIVFQAQKFKYILETAYKNYNDSIDIDKVSEAAFSAMLKDLDPHSVYLNAKKSKDIDERNKGTVEGIGVELTAINDTIVVHSVVEGGPSDSAGLLPGDMLLFIDSEKATGLTTDQALTKLNGPIFSTVSLIVKRGHSSFLHEFKINRKNVEITSMSGAFIIPGTKVGIIISNRFSKLSDKEFLDAAEKLKKQGMKKIIIDVRGNPGGYLEQVCNIIDEFLPAGKIITYTQAKNPVFDFKYKSTEKAQYLKMPIIVLIDDVSASASEVLAGAIQDYDRGLVLGLQSFGKGSAQRKWDINDGSGFILTVAKYHTPSGRCLDKQKVDEKNKPIIDPSLPLYEGPEVHDQIEQYMQQFGGRANVPIYKTSKGRNVIGGGGIIPDYIIGKDTTTLLTTVCHQKNIFLEYVYSYLSENREKLLNKYKGYKDFYDNFIVDEKMLQDFKQVSIGKNTWNEQMFLTDKEYIQAYIKAFIGKAIWGNNAFFCEMLRVDDLVKKAIELFPEAEKMAEDN